QPPEFKKVVAELLPILGIGHGQHDLVEVGCEHAHDHGEPDKCRPGAVGDSTGHDIVWFGCFRCGFCGDGGDDDFGRGRWSEGIK
ncbi:hypothetical protein CH063_08746, partial [Colletotrichum higginsianum]